MNPFVLDASVTMAWVLPGEGTSQARTLLDGSRTTFAITPILWQFEVANVLGIAHRKGRLTQPEAFAFLLSLEELNIRQHGLQPADVLGLSLQMNLTAYDASYLLLSIQNDLPFATLDRKLNRAATDLHIQTLGT